MNENKFWYESEILDHYDEVLFAYDSLRKEGIYLGDPPIVLEKWDNIVGKHGQINESDLAKNFIVNRLYSIS